MAIDLNSISRTTMKPPRVVVYGEQKIGKSTFGASAHKPIFIQTEDGLDGLNVPAFPLASSYLDVVEALNALLSEDHDYSTVVVDSLDWLEPLIWQHVCQLHQVDSIEKVAGGYGKGYTEAKMIWIQLLATLKRLRDEKNMAIILIAHYEIKRFDDPNSAGWDRYQIKLHKHPAGLVEEWCDIIGFAAHEVSIQKEDKGFNKTQNRGIGTGRRLLHLERDPSFVAGNRYNLPSPIEFSWTALMEALANNTQTNQAA